MRILVFQHVDVEHPGVFREFWNEAGDELVAVELDQGETIPPLEDFDLLVVMGGPQDVWQEDRFPWLIEEKAAIRRWVKDLGKPYLGICLGHQLLGEALGGKVEKMSGPEVGLTQVQLTPAGQQDPVLAGFPRQVESFQWHGAEVATPPEGAVVLASNEACAVQAMRWGEHAYGFQYHCEIEISTVDDWEAIPEYKASLIKALGEDKANGLANEVMPRLPHFRAAALKLNQNFMKLLKNAAATTA
ncbi:MAG: type 1 glutamine amidotransferase [Xanthobacteraceae bacterium]|nr:type 1 glutamine amidotransferase [Xanthobacteraceae bacterium]